MAVLWLSVVLVRRAFEPAAVFPKPLGTAKERIITGGRVVAAGVEVLSA